MSSFVSIVKTIATVMVSFALIRWGRKIIIKVGFLLLSVSSIVLMLGFYFLDSEPDLADRMLITGYFLFVTVFGFSLGPCMWIYIAEVVEPRFMALAVGSQWAGASIVILSFPIITDNMLGGNPWKIYIFFAAWSLFAMVMSQLFLV